MKWTAVQCYLWCSSTCHIRLRLVYSVTCWPKEVGEHKNNKEVSSHALTPTPSDHDSAVRQSGGAHYPQQSELIFTCTLRPYLHPSLLTNAWLSHLAAIAETSSSNDSPHGKGTHILYLCNRSMFHCILRLLYVMSDQNFFLSAPQRWYSFFFF